jgi:hypothetical protein
MQIKPNSLQEIGKSNLPKGFTPNVLAELSSFPSLHPVDFRFGFNPNYQNNNAKLFLRETSLETPLLFVIKSRKDVGSSPFAYYLKYLYGCKEVKRNDNGYRNAGQTR